MPGMTTANWTGLVIFDSGNPSFALPTVFAPYINTTTGSLPASSTISVTSLTGNSASITGLSSTTSTLTDGNLPYSITYSAQADHGDDANVGIPFFMQNSVDPGVPGPLP